MTERSSATAAKLPSPNDIKLINEAHQAVVAANQRAIERAIECGEMLKEAKRKVGHGGWADWLTKHCPDISERTASQYMRLATKGDDLEKAMSKNGKALADLSITTANKLLAKPQTPEQKAARVAKRAAEQVEKEAERPLATEQQCVTHLKALTGADEVLDLLKRTYDITFLTSFADLLFDHLGKVAPQKVAA